MPTTQPVSISRLARLQESQKVIERLVKSFFALEVNLTLVSSDITVLPN